MNAADHLDALAGKLAAAGWSTRAQYEDVPAVLLVFASRLDIVVSVKAGTGGVPWFVSSGGDPLRPCHDLAGTVGEIEVRFRTSPAVAGDRRPPRLRVFGRFDMLLRTGG